MVDRSTAQQLLGRPGGEDLLLPLLRQRWSPRQFDPHHQLSEAQLDSLLEAARWAPSAGNSQPWGFHAVTRQAPGWPDVVDCLDASSRPWAIQASVLVVNISHTLVEDTDCDYSEFSHYDLGQAVAHMTIQAQALGLSCRQFRAFNKQELTSRLKVPAHWEIMTITAIGLAAPGATRGPRASQRAPSVLWPRT